MMTVSQLTRCPHCETIFRVQDSQLKLAQGKVRCGACFSVFNGEQQRIDEAMQLLDPSAAQNIEQFDNAEELNPNTLLVDNVLLEPKKIDNSSLEQALNELEDGVNKIVEHSDKDAILEQETSLKKHQFLSSISEDIKALDNEISAFESNYKQSDAVQPLSDDLTFEDSPVDLEIDAPSSNEDKYDHPEISHAPSLEEVLEDFNDDELTDDLDSELDSLLRSDEHEPTDSLAQPTMPSTPETNQAIEPTTTTDSPSNNETTNEPNNQTGTSETTNSSDLKVAALTENIDYEGFDDSDAAYPSNEDKASANSTSEPWQETPDSSDPQIAIDDELVNDLELFTQNLMQELEAQKAPQEATVDAETLAEAEKIDGELIDDLDAFTQQLAADIAATMESQNSQQATPKDKKPTLETRVDESAQPQTPTPKPEKAVKPITKAAQATDMEEKQTKTTRPLKSEQPLSTTTDDPSDDSALTAVQIFEQPDPITPLDEKPKEKQTKLATKPDDTEKAAQASVISKPSALKHSIKQAKAQIGQAQSKNTATSPAKKTAQKSKPTPSNSQFEKQLQAELKAQNQLRVLISRNKNKNPLKPLWIIGSLILCLGLYAQILWVQKDRFSQHPSFRSHLELICQLFSCAVPPLKALDKIKLVERQVLPNNNKDRVLDVRLVIANTANFEQPFPHIELIFTDQIGATVASRRFAPDEYILSDNKISTIPSNVEVNIRFSVKQPARKVTGYQFKFH